MIPKTSRPGGAPRPAPTPYPSTAAARDQWILARRGPRRALDPRRPWSVLVEEERADGGAIVPVLTVFLTNRECPWRCVMCDLWKNTLEEAVPRGAIPAQMDVALAVEGAATARQVKLYNSGSFFDRGAIPPEDWPALADRVRRFERVIVECHPTLVGESAARFRDLIGVPLEVAMGLETAHAGVLEKLNKRMTLELFRARAEFLRTAGIALRVFVLVRPPFLDETEALAWACRSIDFAFECGATVVSLIPTRPGEGALAALAARGEFAAPCLATLEAAAAYGIGRARGRVFADLWDLDTFSNCAECCAPRRDRLRRMNREQSVPERVSCSACGGGT